ncbi:hypothetical protein Tco_0396131, partial [Tanacetum coccineum]
EYTNLFSIKFHYDGRFTYAPNRKYIEGEVAFVDMIEISQCKLDLLYSLLNSSGYDCNEEVFFHYKTPLKSLDIALKLLFSETDINNMLGYVHKHKIMYVYVKHSHTTIGTSNEQHMNKTFEIMQFKKNVNVMALDELEVRQSSDESESEDGEGDVEDESESEDGEDNAEDIVDEEHIVDEIEVNMSGFKFELDGEGESEFIDPIQPQVTVTENDLEVLDFDSLINFYVGKEFANMDVAKDRIRAYSVQSRRNIDFKKNDKEKIRMKCNGVVPSLSSKDVFVDKVQGSKEKKGYTRTNAEKKFHVGVSKTKAFRAKANAHVHLRGDANVQYSLLRDYNEIEAAYASTTMDNPCLTQKAIAKEWFNSNYGLQIIGRRKKFMKDMYPVDISRLYFFYWLGLESQSMIWRLKNFWRFGESGSVEMEGMEDKLKSIRDKVDQFEMKDIFNMDETAAITLNNFLLSYEKTTPEVLTMLRKIRDEIQGEIDFIKYKRQLSHFSGTFI